MNVSITAVLASVRIHPCYRCRAMSRRPTVLGGRSDSATFMLELH